MGWSDMGLSELIELADILMSIAFDHFLIVQHASVGEEILSRVR